jgi:hypothetical protein
VSRAAAKVLNLLLFNCPSSIGPLFPEEKAKFLDKSGNHIATFGWLDED